MRTRRRSDRWTFLALALAVAAVATAEEPQKWLERMNRALLSRNYDGVFSHWQGGKVEMLRIIHRVQHGTVTERLVSLDGSGREFIRRGSELACYLPDEHTVLVQRDPRPKLLLGNLPSFDASASHFYSISDVRRVRVLGRPAQLIAVDPRDEFRYGYRLWIDESTAMPLKTQLCDRNGQVLEQVIFASLTTARRIPDAAFEPAVSTQGFTWLHEEVVPATGSGEPVVWSAVRLPPGFRMSARQAQVMPGSHVPAAHLVFSDGVASVSVFVESRVRSSTERPLNGSAQFGSSSAFSAVIEGHQVTAVGEVPLNTVRFIVSEVRARPHEDPPDVPAPGSPAAASSAHTSASPASADPSPAFPAPASSAFAAPAALPARH